MAILNGTNRDDLTLKYLLENNSGGAKVHVGEDEPSDSKVNIWLDTDESGIPYVTSVNGASGAATVVSSINGVTGDIVLDADSVHAMCWDLLWENASPTSSFATQTVNIDLSDYTFVLVGIRWSTSADQISWQVCIVGETNKVTRCDAASSKVWVARRNIQVTASGVTFEDADQGNSTSDPSTNNGEVIPVSIYGIKGVITS